MRVSVQLRRGAAGGGERWQRSVYVDTFDQQRTVFFDDCRAGRQTARRPTADSTAIRSLLFVVDTTNTKPGASGRIWIRNVDLD